MFGVVTGVFVFWAAMLIPLALSHRHLREVIYLDAIFKVAFFVSPLVALWLGWQGRLPGTR